MNDIINWEEELKTSIKNNRKLEAIKCYRLWKDSSLKVAADYIRDNWDILRGQQFAVQVPATRFDKFKSDELDLMLTLLGQYISKKPYGDADEYLGLGRKLFQEIPAPGDKERYLCE